MGQELGKVLLKELASGQRQDSGNGNGNALQYSCLENSMDREAGQATVREVRKESDTATKQQEARWS